MASEIPSALVGAVKSGRWPVPDTVALRVWCRCEPEAVGQARAQARRFVAQGRPGDAGVVDDVARVASELAANAVVHAGGAGFWMTLTRSAAECTVAVEDTGAGGSGGPSFPVPGKVAEDPEALFAESGRGLAIVAALCPADHGYAPAESGSGFVVWGTVWWGGRG